MAETKNVAAAILEADEKFKEMEKEQEEAPAQDVNEDDGSDRDENPEIDEETKRRQQIMNQAKDDYARSVFNNINYRALFTLCGQLQNYEKFRAYTVEYEQKSAEIIKKYEEECKARRERGEGLDEAPALDKPLAWTEFLDDKAAMIENLAKVYDSMLASATNIALGAAEVIHAALYDCVVGPQFAATQNNFETFGAVLGDIVRRLENCEKKLGIDPNEGKMKVPEKAAE